MAKIRAGRASESTRRPDLESQRATPTPRALVACVAVGLALEAMWLLVGALSAWVTDVPSFTAALGPAEHIPWAWFHGHLEAWLGPDRTGLVPAAPSQLAQLAFVGGLGLACAGYVLMLAILRRCATVGNTMTVAVFAFAMLFVTTACWIPGFLSGDAILYATFGRLAGVHGLDPYLPPSAWSPLGNLDGAWWWFDPTPYGPAWTDLSALLAQLTSELSPTAQVLTFKVLAAVAFAADLWLIWWLVPRLAPAAASRKERLTAVALFGWNPLVVFETGQGHNDILIASILLASLVPLVAQHRVFGRADGSRTRTTWPVTGALLTLDTLIKYVPVIVGVFLMVLRLRKLRGRRARVQAVALVGLLACGLTILAALPWRDSSAVLGAMLNATSGGQRYANSIVDIPSFPLVARYLDKLSEHIQESLALVRFWEQVVVRGLMAAYVAWEIRRIWRLGPRPPPAALKMTLGAALRVSLLTVIFVLTQTLDYYFISPLALAVVLGWQSTSMRVAVAISVLFLPTFYLRRMELEPVPNLFLIGALVGPLLVGLVAGRRVHQSDQRLPERTA